MMKKLPIWIAAGMILGIMSVAGAADVKLVVDGKAAGRIVVPDNAVSAEQFAAEELRNYIQRMSGASLEIVKAGQAGDGPAIYIGNQPANEDAISRLNEEHHDTMDAFAVWGKGNRLSLVGRSADSTIWAAWQWLEDQGVVWLMPGARGMYVPHRADIEIADTQKIESPGMAFRGGLSGFFSKGAVIPDGINDEEHGVPGARLFALRMRFNMYVAFDEKDVFVAMGSGHSYAQYLPASKYYQAHPEWFNLINGKRMNGERGTQVCFTNAQAAAEFARNVEGELKQVLETGVPIGRIRIAVSPNDWKAMCECDNCRKLIDKDGSASSLVTHFCNLVTADIRKDYPGATTKFYAYDNYSTPPDHVKPGPGVIPEIVFWTAAESFAANHAHPMFSQANHKYRDCFTAWEQMSDAVTVHTYYCHYNWFTPWPEITQMANDIPHMAADPKFQGMYSELHIHWGTQGLNAWLYPKLMWNPKLDVKKAIRTYCQAAYGPAAVAIQAYYATVQEAMDSLGYISGGNVEIPQLLTPEVVSKVDGLIAQAEARLEQMDPDTRWRTEMVCQAWHASAKYAEAIRLFTRGSGNADRIRMGKLLEEVGRFANSSTGRWAFVNEVAVSGIRSFSNILKLDLTSLPAGEHRYADSFEMGGAIKFFGRIGGFQVGRWGYSLPVNGVGQIDLPLQAAAGHRIVSATVRWDVLHPERYSGELSFVQKNGEERLLTKDISQITGGVNIPVEGMGGVIRLKLKLLNQHFDGGIALTGCTIDVKVE